MWLEAGTVLRLRVIRKETTGAVVIPTATDGTLLTLLYFGWCKTLGTLLELLAFRELTTFLFIKGRLKYFINLAGKSHMPDIMHNPILWANLYHI